MTRRDDGKGQLPAKSFDVLFVNRQSRRSLRGRQRVHVATITTRAIISQFEPATDFRSRTRLHYTLAAASRLEKNRRSNQKAVPESKTEGMTPTPT
jgi:hypothetical protein